MEKVKCNLPNGITARQAGYACSKSSYMPYGFDASQPTRALGFNGQPRDRVAGCYLLGAGYRAFSPVLMRFNSSDSWSPFGEGGWNSYAYVACDPVNFCDPTGHVKYPQRALQPGKRPDSLALQPQKPSSPVAKTPPKSRSNSSASSSSVSLTPSTPSAGSSPRSLRYGAQISWSSSISSDSNKGWQLKKNGASFKVLTEAEQKVFDVFQNAIHHFGMSPKDAAMLAGASNYKLLSNSKVDNFQVRLSKAQRVSGEIEGKVAIIRQVGGHT